MDNPDINQPNPQNIGEGDFVYWLDGNIKGQRNYETAIGTLKNDGETRVYFQSEGWMNIKEVFLVCKAEHRHDMEEGKA